MKTAAKPDKAKRPPPERRGRGFEPVSKLVDGRIRAAAGKRGFVASRLLTRWREFVGDETASMSMPVKISYGRDEFGSTLTLLCLGAWAPVLQAESENIRERINACFGYSAVAKIKLTQTSDRLLFGESRERSPAPKPRSPAKPVSLPGVLDPGLREALEALGRNVMSRGA